MLQSYGFEFMIQCLVSWVCGISIYCFGFYGSWFIFRRFQGLEFMGQGLRFYDLEYRFCLNILTFRIKDSWFRIQALGFQYLIFYNLMFQGLLFYGYCLWFQCLSCSLYGLGFIICVFMVQGLEHLQFKIYGVGFIIYCFLSVTFQVLICLVLALIIACVQFYGL